MAGDNIPFGADTTEAVNAAKQTKVGQVNNLNNAGATGLPASERTSAGGDTISPGNNTRENWGAGVQGTPHGSVTKNPNIESLDSDADGTIQGLELPQRLDEVRVGKGLYGSKQNGVEEVTVGADGRPEIARDNINMPTNQDSQRNESIPNVASRFFR